MARIRLERMTTYNYTALDKLCRSTIATIEANSRPDALAKLQQLGLFALDLREARTVFGWKKSLRKGAVTQFYSMLHDQLEVGVPILKALEVIRSQERCLAAKKTIDEIALQVTSGSSLSCALSYHPATFPALDVNVVRAGEEGGFLRESLARVLHVREWQASLRSTICGTMAYPLILLSVSAILVPGMLIFLVPKFEPLFESLKQAGKMPWATSLLLNSASLAKSYLGFGLLSLLVAIVVALWLIPRARMREIIDQGLMRTPLVGPIARDLALARFFRVFGTLLQNKIPILRALDISAMVVGNCILHRAIESAKTSVAGGGTLTEKLAESKQIPADVLAMLGVGEQSNTLDSVLIKIAAQVETRSRKRLEFSIKLLEPAMLLSLALLVGFMAIALLLPVFEGQGLT
jgi:general secretion pathway protein F